MRDVPIENAPRVHRKLHNPHHFPVRCIKPFNILTNAIVDFLPTRIWLVVILLHNRQDTLNCSCRHIQPTSGNEASAMWSFVGALHDQSQNSH